MTEADQAAMQQHYEALRAAETAEEVASILLEGGYKGEPGSVFSCPIARSFERLSGTVTKVTAEDGIVFADGSWLSMSGAMEQFIMDFDEGGFPELEEPNP